MKYIDLNKIKTYSIADRKSKVGRKSFAKPMGPDVDMNTFFKSLPDVLMASSFKKVVDKIVAARKKRKPVILFMGAHVIKCGLGPVVNSLIEEDVITHVGTNGASLIHDFELAFAGETSEEVGDAISGGSFGMARETATFINNSAAEAAQKGEGLARTVGKRIEEEKLPNRKYSVFAACHRKGISSSAHIAVGTDIVHQHPSCNGAAWGESSFTDFKCLAETVFKLNNGGVVLAFGSTVIMPEVFLKALTVARNLKGKVENFLTAYFDMYRHYRPQMNIVSRPVLNGGEGFYFSGHHELMLPLLAAGIFSKMRSRRRKK